MKPDNQVKVSNLLTGLREPALLINPHTQVILKANKPAVAMLGVDDPEQLSGAALQTYYDGPLYSFTEAIVLNGLRNGTAVRVDFRLSPLKLSDQELLLAIGREIATDADLRIQLHQLAKEKALQETRAHFISMTSHELRTPITAIASSLELMEAKMLKDDVMSEFYNHQIAKISTELFNLTTLLDEIMTMSNLVSDKYKVVKSAVNAQDVVTYLREQYFSERKDGRSLQVKCTGTPRNIYVDKNQLHKILTNLISNAFKFSTEGNPSLKLNYQEKKLVIKVRDTGIGIPTKELPNLFNSFYRASNAANIEGTGLGLVIVKTFVDSNDGTITVESEKDKGTTFTLSFKYSE